MKRRSGLAALPGLLAVLAPAAALAQPDLQLTGAVPAVETRYFLLSGDVAGLGMPADELKSLFDPVFEYVAERVGLLPDAMPEPGEAKIRVEIQSPANASSANNCPRRGLSVFGSDAGFIVIYADAETSRKQLIGVFAHEVGHVLMGRALGGVYRMFDLTMPEGYATWAAGRFTLDWYGIDSLQQAVARQVESGSYIPVFQPVGDFYLPPGAVVPAEMSAAACMARRDQVYTAWGAFVEFLVERDGHDTLLALLRSGGSYELAFSRELLMEAARSRALPVPPEAPPPPAGLDYAGIYGRSAAELEAEWLSTLR